MSMKVLVTGGDGFIGSHLTERLVQQGYQVKAMVQYNSFNSWGWLDSSPIKDSIEVIAGDIRDSNCCKEALEGVELVFHLAALIAIPYSYIAPASYIDTNVNGTLNICKAALDKGNCRVVTTSTSEVYGTAQYVPIDEKHPLQPQSPYSASKISADAIAMSLYNSFELPLTIARPFNTYGPRQSARAVIPTIISQIANGVKEIQLGDLSPTRDFNYVEDTCDGLIALGLCERAIGSTVNIGSNFEISIADTLDTIKRLMASDVVFTQDPARLRPKSSEVFRLWADNNLMQELTGFIPKTDIEQGLQKTIDWFTNGENLKYYKHLQYNV